MGVFIDSVSAVRCELGKGRYSNVEGLMERLSGVCREYATTGMKDFRMLSKLAKGAYGEVFLAERDGRLFAVKRISKETIVGQPFTALFMSEKELMVDARGSMWLLYAHCTFHDDEAVYFVTDFLPGGDFMGYLVRRPGITEDEIRFYGAEVVCALEELHGLGYIHRDLKPENLLIERSGHIKLADFGSCTRAPGGRVRCSSTVGTPDYVSPDVLCGVGTEVEYGSEVDLWTLGAVLYEMLYEAPPFYSETLQETYERISNIDFAFPEGGSDEFRDLVGRLLCRREERLTVEGVKAHAFFRGVDWGGLRRATPPFVPELDGEADVRNFERPESACTETAHGETRSGDVHALNFVGFTFDPVCFRELAQRLGTDRPAGPAQKGAVHLLQQELCRARKSLSAVRQGLQRLEAQLGGLRERNQSLRMGFSEARSQNLSLISSLNSVSLENKTLRESERGARLQFYKKELRIKRTEAREFQQKLEAEIVARNRMEDEVAFLRREVERLGRRRGASERTVFRVKVAGEEGPVESELVIEGQEVRLLDQESNINNVFVKPLRNNELFHMGYLERSMTVCIVIARDVAMSTESGSRTSVWMLEDAIRKEEAIEKGIERILRVSPGSVKGDGRAQLEGSRRRLAYLRGELERGRRASCTEDGDCMEGVRLYEYNSHVFRTRTFAPQTFCEHCNDVMRGVRDQGLECSECQMAVHRSCYVLSDISCEMYSAMRRGARYYVTMQSTGDRERLLRLAKA